MNTELLTTLEAYGFSEKEAKVYLTILELGTSVASTIARRAELNRVTTYTILEGLKRDGVTNETIKEGVKYYSVISPNILLKQLEQKYESFKEKVPAFLDIAEKLGNRPKLTYYEGVQGIKNLYNQILNHEQEIYAFLSDDDITPELEEYLIEKFVCMRIEKKIPVSVILPNKDNHEKYIKNVKNTESETLTKIKIAKGDLMGLRGEIMLFGEDSVACALYGKSELVGYIIKSKQFYQSMKAIFMFIWNIL